MSVQQFFNEVEAVASILNEWVGEYDADHPPADEEQFTALWQAVELLSRSHYYISAQMNAVLAEQALSLPEAVTEQPRQPKAARLYGPNGRPLSATSEGNPLAQ